jgi:hypothetical protein
LKINLKIKLAQILKEENGILWTDCVWFMIGANGQLLWKKLIIWGLNKCRGFFQYVEKYYLLKKDRSIDLSAFSLL